jgi:hypothetical protein
VPDKVPGMKYHGIALAILLCLCVFYGVWLLKTDPSFTACQGQDRLSATSGSTVQFVKERKRLWEECHGGD